MQTLSPPLIAEVDDELAGPFIMTSTRPSSTRRRGSPRALRRLGARSFDVL
jgi:hypothetical protein